MKNVLLQHFPGVIGFPVTPFSDRGDLDINVFRENIEFMLDSKLSALACCGSNGELQALLLDEYREIAEAAGSLVAGQKD